MIKNRLLFLFTILLIVVFILPFVFVSKFVIPNTDDLCRAALEKENYLINIKEWYLHHNGRLINAVFTLIPIYKITIYRLIIASQFFILGFILYDFFSNIFNLFSVKLNRAEIFFISVVFHIVIIANIPSVFDYFYWYASVTVYLFSFYFFLFFLKYSFKFYFTGKLNLTLFSIIVICVVGNNELLIGFISLLLILLTLFDYFKRKHWNRSLVFLNIIAALVSFVVILAPGTANRRNQFEYGGNFFGSIKVAIKYGAEFLIESTLNVPFLLFYIFIFLLTYKNIKSIKSPNYIHPICMLGITYTSLCTIFFILFFATGLLDIYTGRIANFINCIMLIFITLNVINLAVFLRIKFNSKNLNLNATYFYFLILVFLSIIGLNNTNYAHLRNDFLQDNFSRFDKDYKNRIQKIQDNEKDKLELMKIENTNLLRAGDAGLINEEWVKDCYIRVLNETNDNKVKHLYITE